VAEYQLRDFESALRYSDRTLQAARETGAEIQESWLLWRGGIFLALERFTEAAENRRELYAQFPTEQNRIRAENSALIAQGRFDDLVEKVREACRRNPVENCAAGIDWAENLRDEQQRNQRERLIQSNPPSQSSPASSYSESAQSTSGSNSTTRQAVTPAPAASNAQCEQIDNRNAKYMDYTPPREGFKLMIKPIPENKAGCPCIYEHAPPHIGGNEHSDYFWEYEDAKKDLYVKAENWLIEECESRDPDGRLVPYSVSYSEFYASTSPPEPYRFYASEIRGVCVYSAPGMQCNARGRERQQSPPGGMTQPPKREVPKNEEGATASKPSKKEPSKPTKLDVEFYGICLDDQEGQYTPSHRACVAFHRKDENTLCANSDGTICAANSSSVCVALGKSSGFSLDRRGSGVGRFLTKQECMNECNIGKGVRVAREEFRVKCYGYLSKD
jgi:tetratricopeptide (TPR) repeat protein